jgi:glycosyltransferase involved in cell wall biosynthesis
MLITVFTPTYNRAYTLSQLYKSLVKQTNKSFEWLIVDDGSIDNTRVLVKQWKEEKKVDISYIKTPNGGKQRAINIGVKHAKGKLFFIVDSDDFLTTDAVEKIHSLWQIVETEEVTGGLLLRKILNNKVLGGAFPCYQFKANSLEVAYKYGVKQDKAEVFATEKLKEFPFPVAKDEKFVPESYIWNRLTKKYPLWCVDEAIYNCEYLPDGYTYNVKQNFKRNPKGFALYYKDVLGYKEVPFKDKIKALIRYFQMQYYILCKKKS